jgi:hypothetical protein
MGGEATTLLGTYSYIEMYEGTPELQPETGPVKDAALDGEATTNPRVIAESVTVRLRNLVMNEFLQRWVAT